MKGQLTQKERMMLQDQQTHEKICIQKYNKYASQAEDSQLQQLFSSYAQQEQQHLNTINQMLSGQVPSMTQQQGQQQSQSGMQSQTQSSMQSQTQTQGQSQASSTTQSTTGSQSDNQLCTDMLMTEKYVSGAYDTAIFEFSDPNVRQVLNHIQKEEQEHGQGIFQYMQSRGMYNIQ